MDNYLAYIINLLLMINFALLPILIVIYITYLVIQIKNPNKKYIIIPVSLSLIQISLFYLYHESISNYFFYNMARDWSSYLSVYNLFIVILIVTFFFVWYIFFFIKHKYYLYLIPIFFVLVWIIFYMYI